MGADLGVPDLVVHAFTDGRDTSPTGGERFVGDLERWLAEAGNGRVGSVIGRYYAMDRDKRWERTQLAYDLLVHGKGEHEAASGVDAVRAAYERDETDEFITATTVGDEARIRPGDSVIAFNFRPDRMREITLALADPSFTDVDRGGAGAGRSLRDAHRVRGRLALPGGVPAGAPEEHPPEGDRRDGRPRSCTSRRRRSTRT